MDLQIQVFEPAGAPAETIPPGSSILANADILEVVDFALSGASHPASSDFQSLTAAAGPLLGGSRAGPAQGGRANPGGEPARRPDRPIAERGRRLLHREPRRRAGQGSGAARLRPAAPGITANLPALQAAHSDVKLAAVKSAVAQGVVPATINGAALETFLTGLAPQPDATVTGLLSGLLNPEEMTVLWGHYLSASSDPDAFWKQIARIAPSQPAPPELRSR